MFLDNQGHRGNEKLSGPKGFDGGTSYVMGETIRRLNLKSLQFDIYEFDKQVHFVAHKPKIIHNPFKAITNNLPENRYFESIEVTPIDSTSTLNRVVHASELLPPTIRDLYLNGYMSHPSLIDIDCFGISTLFNYPEMRENKAEIYTSKFLCSGYYKLPNGYDPAFGDQVRLVRPNSKGFDHVHTFTYLAPNLGFSKNGDGINKPFCIQPTSQIKKIYETSEHSELHMEYWRPQRSV